MPIMYPWMLKKIPLFALLDDEEVAVLSEQLEQKRVWAGQMIFQQGDPGGTMYVVQSGAVEIFIKDRDGQKVTLSRLEAGEIFGELSLLDNEPRSACAKAVDDTFLFIIDRNDLEVLFSRHREAALDIMAMLSKRLREANQIVSDRVVSRNVNEELAEQRTVNQRMADLFAYVAGDMRFVYACAIWFAVWIVWNLGVIPGLPPFDPFPFGLLTMIVSLQAIFLSTFVLVSANRQAERDKIRNDIEYDVNIKAELEIRELHNKVDELQELLLGHLQRIDHTVSEVGGAVKQAVQPTVSPADLIQRAEHSDAF